MEDLSKVDTNISIVTSMINQTMPEYYNLFSLSKEKAIEGWERKLSIWRKCLAYWKRRFNRILKDLEY